MENNSNCGFFGDPLLDTILELSSCSDKREVVMIANPAKQKALSAAYDILEAIVRSTGAKESVDVQYHYSTRCASLSAEVPGIYLSAPWMMAVVLAEASNVQIVPTCGGNIRISLYFSEYFRKCGGND